MLLAVRPAQPGVHSAHARAQLTAHVMTAATAFDRACQLSGLSSAALCRRLPPLIGKDNVLSRQTLAAWRQGRRHVPMAAFLAASELAGLRPPMIFALAAKDSPAS